MRQFEDRLRADLQSTKVAPTVTKETMLARVARARRRRTVAAGAGALAGCALALIIMVPMLSRAVGGSGHTGADPPRLIHDGRLFNVVFTDATHGYALQQRCTSLHPDDVVNPNPQETPDIQSECETKLLATADAGASWQERAVPERPAHKDAGVNIVLGHSMMLWVPAPGTLAMGGFHRRYWTTTDGGVTWNESPTPYALGPEGSFGVLGIDDEHVFLASPPGSLRDAWEGALIVPARDGSYWQACFKDPCLRLTRDQGVSWQDLPLQVAGGTDADFVATADGQTVYASVSALNVNSTLLRSTDGGLTWLQVPGVTVPFRIADGIALPNGDLVVFRSSEAGGLFRLTAGSTTFQEVSGPPTIANAFYRTGGWLVAARWMQQSENPDLGSLAYVSRDNGVTWIAVPQP